MLLSDPRVAPLPQAHLPTQQLLMGLSLELALKAYALSVGVHGRVLKNGIGHKLPEALSLCQERGLAPPSGLKELCRDLDRGYQEHWWRYMPDVEEVAIVHAPLALPVIVATLSGVGKAVGEDIGL